MSDGTREGEGLPEQPTSGYDQWRGYEPWPGAHAGMPPPPRYVHVPPTTPPPTRGSKRLLVGLVAALVLASGAFGAWLGVDSSSKGSDGQRAAASAPAPVQPGASTDSVANAVSPAIVNIDTFARSFGSSQLSPLGAGTGMILTSSGEVLTNNHVVEGAMRIDVSIQGRSTPVTADVVGVDPANDVALLRLQGVSGLPTVTLGQPDDLTVGQNVIAIGNALGKGGSPTVTTGSVSALHRSITANDPAGASSEHLSDVIATDAPIVPGDSGGALVDGSGRVVGMITAGGTRGNEQGTANVGFAIPVDNALSIVNQMRAGQGSGTILLGDRGFLGVAVHPLDGATAAQLNVTSGALVVGVEPNGPAANIGMTDPAVITQVDGHAIASYTDLGTYLHAHVPGDQASITWVDRQGSHTATATLTTGPVV